MLVWSARDGSKAMTSEREELPGRQFAGEPQAKRSWGGALEARETNQAQGAPGRRTLAESLDPAPIDIARVFDAQLAVVSRQLVALEAANHAGNHHASCMAAAGMVTALRLAETMVAQARAESGHHAGALQRRLAVAREVTRSALAQAFSPSAAAKREAVDGVGWSQWHREVAMWRAARGFTDLEAVSTATAPEARAAGSNGCKGIKLPSWIRITISSALLASMSSRGRRVHVSR